MLRLVAALSFVVVGCGSGLVDSTVPEATTTTSSATMEATSTTLAESSTTVAVDHVNEAR